MPRMGKLEKLRRERARLVEKFIPNINELMRTKDHNKMKELLGDHDKELDNLDWQIEEIQSDELIQRAEHLDIEAPDPDDDEMWFSTPMVKGILSPPGRLYLRKLIDEEEIRRREVKAWWWKTIILPAFTLTIGLIGAITGLVAVLHHK